MRRVPRYVVPAMASAASRPGCSAGSVPSRQSTPAPPRRSARRPSGCIGRTGWCRHSPGHRPAGCGPSESPCRSSAPRSSSAWCSCRPRFRCATHIPASRRGTRPSTTGFAPEPGGRRHGHASGRARAAGRRRPARGRPRRRRSATGSPGCRHSSGPAAPIPAPPPAPAPYGRWRGRARRGARTSLRCRAAP